MTKFQASQRRSEQGFTLVELAIVMVIIGLLIGGILKGQELIATAKIASTVSQIKSVDAAINTFQEKYNALPGDILLPGTRLPSCTGTCNTAGDGNSRIGTSAPTALPAGEATIAFVHLNAADLVSGINPAGGVVAGGQIPAVRAGGAMWVSYAAVAPAGTTLGAGRHYATLSTTAGAPGTTNGALPTVAASNIDRKIDDGIPLTGSAQTIGTGCSNGAGTASTYDEANNAGTCSMIVRVLN